MDVLIFVQNVYNVNNISSRLRQVFPIEDQTRCLVKIYALITP